jgi:exodeoxyribonuclease-3
LGRRELAAAWRRIVKIATWNVNSVRARLDRLVAWLARHSPDALCLQELKVADEAFPFEAIERAGYRAVVHGQKTYNGVAILAREEPTDVACGLGDDIDDPQARLIAATVGGVRVLSAYVPNGGEVGSAKWDYKLAWLARLRRYLDAPCQAGQPLALCGDLNIAPEARDVHDPVLWEGSVLFHEALRGAFAQLHDWGLTDAFRLHHSEGGLYSWWDYRMLAFPKNAGLRIDHILLTAPLASRCTAVVIDRAERKAQQPSDHAPVVAELAVEPAAAGTPVDSQAGRATL